MNPLLKSGILCITLMFAATGCDKSDINVTDQEYLLKAARIKPAPAPPYTLAPTGTSIQVYGVWHAGNDYCTWESVRTIGEFDANNHWLVDRGDGKLSVNLVVLSFVNPLKLLNKTDDATTAGGIPKGMTSEIINYYKGKGIRVMIAIGGITYTDA